MMALTLASCSCGIGRGDIRDRNLQRATIARLDSIPSVDYIGMADVNDTVPEDGEARLSAVVIYKVTDSTGVTTERNSRVVTSADCSEIYSWENLDSTILSDAGKSVTDSLAAKGIRIDGSLIDALVSLKKLAR